MGSREHLDGDSVACRALLSHSESTEGASGCAVELAAGKAAMAALEVLMKVMVSNRKPMARMVDVAVWVEKQWHREGCWW